jgi:predicted transcriptional regulator
MSNTATVELSPTDQLQNKSGKIDKTKLLELINKRISNKQIAEYFGVSHQAVIQCLNRMGIGKTAVDIKQLQSIQIDRKKELNKRLAELKEVEEISLREIQSVATTNLLKLLKEKEQGNWIPNVTAIQRVGTRLHQVTGGSSNVPMLHTMIVQQVDKQLMTVDNKQIEAKSDKPKP